MWSGTVLCLLVGIAFAANLRSENVEYQYEVKGRTLTGLYEVSDQYTGVLYRAKLRIQPRSPQKWMAQISSAEISKVHSRLHDGWSTHIPESELSWTKMEMSEKPFEIVLKSGVITDLIVSKDVRNSEANMLKSIVSQFQLDTKGNRYISSQINTMPEDQKKPTATFKTMEETVTGNTETEYEISPLPEYLLQSSQYNFLKDQDRLNVFQVTKYRNYSNAIELPSYSFGFKDMESSKIATNKMGEFLVRSSYSQAILTGNLDRHVIHNSYTVEQMAVNPTLTDKQKGMVVSTVNVTLEQVLPHYQGIEEVSEPLRLGNLVYSYNSPESYQVREKKRWELNEQKQDENDNENRERIQSYRRHPRSVEDLSSKESSEERKYYHSEETVLNVQSKLEEAPRSPLLRYTVGYKGMPVKKGVDIVNSVQKLAVEIGGDLQDPSKILHENTLDKFTIMTSLVRTMSADELQTAASRLYTQAENGIKRSAWQSFRDAVAESGTGPALITIKSWINTQKIKNEEAVQVISTMANAVRQPTLEYIRAFFEMVKSPVVLNQWPLNDTTIISYADLVYRAIVDKEVSKKEYPVNSFGKFSTHESRKFVKQVVVPYLSEKLEEAINLAETHKIHTYIRALGNIAHPQIFTAYEPYLEGKKQASQFQRLLMVLSMDKIVRSYPEESRSVLYKIYLNPEEGHELRVAAVYGIMSANPPTEMLQYMAVRTNSDQQEHVNAAVKSTIQIAAQLKETVPLRHAAEAALPLLNKKTYGVDEGYGYLRQYMYDELNTAYNESIQFIGSEDSLYLKGFKYSLQSNLNGIKRQVINFQGLLSSIDEFMHVANEQFAGYHEMKMQQKQQSQEQSKHQWSSQNIARLLNLKTDAREQLEANMYIGFGAPYKMWSFDNRSLEQLPEVVRELEDEFRSGKKIDSVKFINSREMALSMPTAFGWPAIFTYDTPILIRVQGQVKALAETQISQNNKLNTPESVHLRSDISLTITSKLQGRLSFVTPFDHQQYVAGFDKHWQVHVPLNGEVQIDVKSEQIKIEWEPKEHHQDAHLLHYSSWPYTSSDDIMSFKPLSKQPNTHYITKDEESTGFERIFGEKETGLALRVQMKHERTFYSSSFLYDLLKTGSLSGTMWSLWNDGSIQHGQLNVSFVPEKSSTRKVVMRFGKQDKYMTESASDKSISWDQYNEASDSRARQQVVMEKVSAGIKNVRVSAYDASVEFKGEKNIEYSLTGALGKSNIEPQSRFVLYYKKSSDDQEVKPYRFSWELSNQIPNTNALDLEYAMDAEPKVDSQIQLSFGNGKESLSKIQAELEFRRSSERKMYLKQQPMYQQCQQEMREGNKQLHACVNMTMAANLLDLVHAKVNYENFSPELRANLHTLYDALRMNYYLTLEESTEQGSQRPNEIRIEARFHPDLKFVNLTMWNEERQSKLKDIQVNDWAKEIFVLHPVFHLRSRLMAKALGMETYRPVCVVDHNKISSFNNRTLSVELSNYWGLMFLYIPQDAHHDGDNDDNEPIEQAELQIVQQPLNVAVMVRANSSHKDQKDLKLTLSSVESRFAVVEIRMTPQVTGPGPKGVVTVDGQQVTFSETEGYQMYDGYLEIYALPSGEVKLEIRDEFYLIYDGVRVRLTVLDTKFRDAVRGFCGSFSDEVTEELLTPQNCIARDPKKFVKSFEIEGQEGKSIRESFSQKTHECVKRIKPQYRNVISDRDARRSEEDLEQSSGRCSHFRTRYIEENGSICFTTHAVPVCHSRCQPRGSLTKNVPVHCLPKTKVSVLWKDQIDRGSSPSFSHKAPTKSVSMQLPQSCAE